MGEEIILIGDKVLIEPDSEEVQTEAGLYLPQGIKEKEKVWSGKVVKVGPGYPVFDPSSLEEESWLNQKEKPKYFPLQAKPEDRCVFLKDQAVEVKIKKKRCLIVPHSAILLLIRESSLEF